MMDTLIILLAGAGAGLGLWLTVNAVRGVSMLPKRIPRNRDGVGKDQLTRIGSALIGALIVGLVTRWPVAAAATFGGVLLAPRILAGKQQRRSDIEVAQAIATWTDMIRDTLAGAAGLEQTIMVTADVAPAAIRTEVANFAARLRHGNLDLALQRLAVDVDHPSADLLVAALSAAGQPEARDLGSLLSRLADAVRADVEMRARVDKNRSRIRASARLQVWFIGGAVVFLFLFARHLLEPYGTVPGQLWLVVVVSLFFLAGWLMVRYSQFEVADRFTLRVDQGESG